MQKKLTTACLALVALAAVVLPAAAQATNHPLLTEPTGTALTGTPLIKLTNTTNFLMLTTAGATESTCTTIKMAGKMTSNVTGNVQGNITSAEFKGTGSEGSCTGFINALFTLENLPWCLKSNESMKTDEFQISGGECGKAPTKIKFTMAVLGSASQKCVYESTSTTAVKGSFTTHAAGDAVLTTPTTGGTLSSDSGFTKVTDDIIFNPCPSSTALKMSLTLETDEATAKPIYISE
jgi:hypothetical protein